MSPILQSLANGSAQGYGAFFGAGAAGAFESIATATGTGSSATITFSSIPSTYQHLQIRILGRNTAATTGRRSALLQFNSDTGNNYVAYHNLYGDGASATADNFTTANAAYVSYMFSASGSASGIFGAAIIDIHDYKSTSKNKTIRAFGGTNTNNSTAGDQAVVLHSSLWLSTSAISSIDIKTDGSNWASGSTFALYGIKGA